MSRPTCEEIAAELWLLVFWSRRFNRFPSRRSPSGAQRTRTSAHCRSRLTDAHENQSTGHSEPPISYEVDPVGSSHVRIEFCSRRNLARGATIAHSAAMTEPYRTWYRFLDEHVPPPDAAFERAAISALIHSGFDDGFIRYLHPRWNGDRNDPRVPEV
jgi:hypothetical protein